jgi:hypothetical protein
MEALAIGLAVYGVAATVAALYWWRTSEGWRTDAREAAMEIEHWVEKLWDLEDKLEAMDIELAEAGNKLQAFKPFDADGNGKPGGSKPNQRQGG